MAEGSSIVRSDSSNECLFEDSGSEYNPNSESGDSESDSDNGNTTMRVTKNSNNSEPSTTAANEPSTTSPFHGRKRRRNPANWKRSIRKALKTAGKAYIGYKGTTVNPRVRIKEFQCRCGCADKFSNDQKDTIFKYFNDLGSHEQQNTYLQSCLQQKQVQTRRPRKPDAKQRETTYQYYITCDSVQVKVCMKAFHALHALKRGRLDRKVRSLGHSPKDGRGKHAPGHKKPDYVRQKLREFIASIPTQETHYCRSKSISVKYLPAQLTVSQLYRDFIDQNPDLRKDVKYWLFNDVFQHDFNLKFGQPKRDICNDCTKMDAECKAASTEQAKMAVMLKKELHCKKAEHFYTYLREVKEASEKDSRIQGICFDYQKNLPLPVTNIGKEYYKRQLWLHSFGVCNLASNDSTIFLSSETVCGKSPNEVISCLKWYVANKVDQSVTDLHVFMDNCASQGKNRYVFAFWLHLSQVRFQNVYLYFPIPGHSFMPIDRIFGNIEKKKRPMDKVIVPSTWVKLIKETLHKKPIHVVYVKRPLTDNGENDGTPVVEVYDFKDAFYHVLVRSVPEFSSIRGVCFKRGCVPEVRTTMSSTLYRPQSFLKRGVRLQALHKAYYNAQNTPDEPRKIKKAKYYDVRSLLEHVTLPEGTTFYDTMTYGSDVEDDVVEME